MLFSALSNLILTTSSKSTVAVSLSFDSRTLCVKGFVFSVVLNVLGEIVTGGAVDGPTVEASFGDFTVEASVVDFMIIASVVLIVPDETLTVNSVEGFVVTEEFSEGEGVVFVTGQDSLLQASVTLACPTQFFPPFVGTGSVQLLSLCRVPPPQLLVQVDQDANLLHCPST